MFKNYLYVILVILGLLFCVTNSQARTIQRENDNTVTSETKSYGPIDPKEAEAFLDEFLVFGLVTTVNEGRISYFKELLGVFEKAT